MMGLTFDKILVLCILAAIVIGPTRLPDAAAQLARLIRMLRHSLDTAKESVREAGGPDLDEVDWKRLDPRQYDPRRIIKEALLEQPPNETKAPESPKRPTPPSVPAAAANNRDDASAASSSTETS